MSDAPKKPNRISIDLTETQKVGLKLLAATRNTTIMQIVRDLIDHELSKKQGLELARDAANATLRRVRSGG